MRSGLGWAWGWILAVGVFLCCPTWAQASPDIQRGIAWLQAQVVQDGTLVTEASALAAPEQVRAEALHALALAASGSAALVAALEQDGQAANEFAARRIVALAAAGRSVADAANALAGRQNDDGGYSLQAPYLSNPLDTALALQALPKAAGAGDRAAAALAWLAQAKHIDGGYGVEASSQVYVTAYVLLAAQTHAGLGAASSVAAGARDWLLAQRNAGHFGAPLDNALALLALLPQTADAGILQPIADALAASQAADGSWDGDPFVTALALRALWQAGRPAPGPTTGGVGGKIVDAAGVALADATAMLLEAPAFAVASGADGSFLLAGIAPGSYTLQVSKLGHQTKSMRVDIAAGGSLRLGTVSLAAASLGATLAGRVTDSRSHAGLAGVLIAAGTASVLTDAQGNYTLTGINPGTATVSASFSNYKGATASIPFVGGATYSFSPALDSLGLPAKTSATLLGKVVDARTGAGITGATVVLGNRTTATAAGGTFAFGNLAAGSYDFTAGAAGFVTSGASVAVAVGDNDLGNVALAATAVADYTLAGIVRDAASGAPIPGAHITVAGTAHSTNSDGDGRYELAGLTASTVRVAVTAAGYLGAGYDVGFAQPGRAMLDMTLTPTAVASGIGFLDVRTGRAEYGPNDEVKFQLTVRNATGAAVELVIVAEAYDQSGNLAFVAKANAKDLGADPPNLPIVFPAGASQPMEFGTYLHRQPAGAYRVVLRGSDTSGRALAEGSAGFSVHAQSLLAGGVVVDPPLAQAGTQQPVSIKAELKNFGNQPIPDGLLTLTVTLDRPDSAEQKAEVGMQAVLRSALFNNARGLVADAAGNFFTVNGGDRKILKFDMAGAIGAFAVLPAGANPVDIAIDGQGNLWIANYSGKVWRVSPQAAIAEFPIDAKYTLNGIDADGAGNLFLTAAQGATESCLLWRDPQGQLVELAGSGLNRPTGIVKDAAGDMIVANAGSGRLSRIGADGRIREFVRGLKQPWGLTQDAAGNTYVADFGGNTVVKVTPAGATSTYASGLAGPTDLKFDGNGNLYVSNRLDHTIVRIRADGSKEVFARGIATQPQGMKYDGAGNLYIANEDGTLRKKDARDNVTVMTTQLKVPRGVAVDGQANAYVANSGNGTVSKVGAAGTSVFASGLASPYGVAVGGAGEIYVSTQNDDRIHVFDALGNRTGTVESAINKPYQILIDAADNIYVLNAASIGKIEAGIQKSWSAFAPASIALDPAGGLVAATSTGLYRISTAGTASLVKNLGISVGGVAAGGNGDIYFSDRSGKKIQKLDAAGALSTVASLPAVPSAIVRDAAGNLYVATDYVSPVGYKILKISPAGAVAELAVVQSGIQQLALHADGRLLASGSTNVVLIDAAGGVSVLPGVSGPRGAASDSAGKIHVGNWSNEEIAIHAADGTKLSALVGYSRVQDVVWTGAGLRFVANGKLYALDPGGVPVRLGSFPALYLAAAGNDLYGAFGSDVRRWDGAGHSAYAALPDFAASTVAAAPDGTLAAGDRAASRVVVFDAARQVAADFAGLYQPYGLSFDAQGRLLVASSQAYRIVRFDGAGTSGVPVAAISGGMPKFIQADGAGNFFVATTEPRVVKLDANGVQSDAGPVAAGTLEGLALDGGILYAANYGRSALIGLVDNQWSGIAAGLANPRGVRVAADGQVYVANQDNDTVVSYAAGTLRTVAWDIVGARALGFDATGRLLAGGNSGALALVDGGAMRDLATQKLFAAQPVVGVAARGSGGFRLLSKYPGPEFSVIDMTAADPVPPPPAGTAVYTAQRSLAAMPAGEFLATVDFGTWLPPYAGDFKFEIRHSGAEGAPANFLHVGPHATGELLTAQPDVPAGNASVPLVLKLKGADDTAIARPEAARAQPLTTVARPLGLAADRAGDLYFTEASGGFWRTSAQGATTRILAGLSLGSGLGVDSNERFYFPAYNAAAGRYEILQADKAGGRAVFAALAPGVEPNGVVVNSRDEVIVASKGLLQRFNQAGQGATLSALGVQYPYGIALDGRDNVYVLNYQHSVTRIKPDGTVANIFQLGDGVAEPQFEYEGLALAADCADNIFVASINWSRANQSPAEEYILAQYVPRSGAVAQVLDGRRIHADLADIDHLVFDRFGNRLLIWTDYSGGRVWQLPVTCGAVGVDAHLIGKPGQRLSGFDRVPQATLPLPDGRTEYVFSLRDVTAEGLSIRFDAPLSGLVLGEERSVIDSGYIAFKNSFAVGDVKVPLDIPTVRVANPLALAASTDRAEYGANTSAAITVALENRAAADAAGYLSVRIVDAAGALVADLGGRPVLLSGQGRAAESFAFAVGNTLAGGYKADASLADANGIVIAKGSADFRIGADSGGNPALAARVFTDQISYLPGVPVRITSRLANGALNRLLENLSIATTVVDAAGTVLFVREETLPQLVPGANKEYVYSAALGMAAPGGYGAFLAVKDAAGQIVARSQTSFGVRSSADTGTGLAGTLQATPAVVPLGDPIDLAASVRNLGNADLAAQPFKLSLLDPNAQAIVAEFPVVKALAMNGETAWTQTWSPAAGLAVAGGKLVAVLTANVGGRETTLAQRTIDILAPTVKLMGQLALPSGEVMPGTTVALGYAVENQGFGGYLAVPLRLDLADPSGAAVFSETQNADLPAGGRVVLQRGWRVQGGPGTYAVKLSAILNGQDLVLASGAIKLAVPPPSLTLDQSLFGGARVLVLAACGGEGEGHEGELGEHASRREYPVVSRHERDRYNDHDCDRDRDGHDTSRHGEDGADRRAARRDDDAQDNRHDHDDDGDGDRCGLGRAQILDALLDELAIAHRVTTDPEVFRRELRTGAYTTYWISGKAEKLRNALAEEIREAVYRGDTLVLDGVHDERNKIFDEVVGVRYKGQLGARDQAVELLAAPFEPGSLPSVGRGLKLEPAGAAVAAKFAGKQPAILVQAYGKGHGLLFGFDLVASVLADVARWPRQAANALYALLPEEAGPHTLGAYVPLFLVVKNPAPLPVDAEVRSTLPPGSTYLAALPSGSVENDPVPRIVWRFPLAASAEQALSLTLRAPMEAGDYTIASEVGVYSADNFVAAGPAQSLSLEVAEAAARLADVEAELRALAVAKRDRHGRDRAAAGVAQARTAIGKNRWDDAIAGLLDAVGHLLELTSADPAKTAALRLSLGRALREAAWRWSQAQQP